MYHAWMVGLFLTLHRNSETDILVLRKTNLAIVLLRTAFDSINLNTNLVWDLSSLPALRYLEENVKNSVSNLVTDLIREDYGKPLLQLLFIVPPEHLSDHHWLEMFPKSARNLGDW